MKIENHGRPTVAIDVESTDHKEHWEANSAELRSKCPVAWSTEHGGHWIVSSYKDVVRIAQDDGTFTTHKTFDPETMHVEGGTALPPMPIVRLIPAETARPEWDIFRGVLNPHLGPRAAEAYRADAQHYAHLLLDQVIESGHIDLVQDFTSPLAALVTMQAIGFPREQWREFADPCHALTSLNKASPEFQVAVAGAQWVERRIDEEIELRKAAPRDDLISQLVTARVDGRPLKDEDIHSTVVNLLFGGVDTTTALTSHTLVHLFRHPEKRRRLIEDRSLLPVAREEFIRFYAPTHGSARTATASACIAGQEIAQGERLYLFYASANRDETVFENANEIDIARFPNKHIGFGAGIHRCVGSFLARVMFDVMMNAVLDRIPDYVVHEAEAMLYPSISPINGWVNIPASFTAGPKSGIPEPEWLHAATSGGGRH